ncbi:unnamed protein product [Thlaspi arvense]|uniref:U1-type domain-containing protein n=1 Tax=Thlaspi arvense TaxID=13288 RepID=A0AAU9SE85_THLAR|nr:unnamed protein product [Thlaspi arvense]
MEGRRNDRTSRYRAIDGDRPPPATDMAPSQSLNPNISFFSPRPIPGTSEDDVQKAIQREIEKQQIRQEIIAAETERRRELIGEVIQEMAIEREMARRRVEETTKGMSLEEKLTMLINQINVPNQNQNNNLFSHKSTYPMHTGPESLVTSPLMQLPQLHQLPEAKATPVLESNKEKLIVLERPDAIGVKRKGDGVGLPEKEPFQRKKLKSKERDMETDVETGETASSKQVESKPKRMFKFWCEVCSVGAFSQTVMRNHEFGRKHKAAIEKQSVQPPPEKAASTSITTAPLSEEDEMASKEAGMKTEGEKKKTVIIMCEICNVSTNSEKMMESHKLGKKHMAQLKKQYCEKAREPHRVEEKHNKPLDGLHTDIVTVPERSLDADSGEKHTNGKDHCLD